MKPQTSSFFGPAPGQLFTQPAQSSLKIEPATSVADTWKFLQSLTVDSEPKAVAVSSFTSQSIAPASLTQDFPTVNLSDLHDYTLNSFIASEQINPAGAVGNTGGVSQDMQNALGGAFRVDDTFRVDDELPEFPSFSEVQNSDVDSININIDDFQVSF